MSTRFSALLNAALMVASLAIASPAFARDNSPMGTITKSTLEGQGYTCSLVGVGFWECTKPGETTYWCDSGSCQPKPLIKQPVKKFPRPILNNQILSQ